MELVVKTAVLILSEVGLDGFSFQLLSRPLLSFLLFPLLPFDLVFFLLIQRIALFLSLLILSLLLQHQLQDVLDARLLPDFLHFQPLLHHCILEFDCEAVSFVFYFKMARFPFVFGHFNNVVEGDVALLVNHFAFNFLDFLVEIVVTGSNLA